jgi:hypothetical protein
MKWVKCVNKLGINLTYGKIYEVIKLSMSDWSGITYVRIINDDGISSVYDISSPTKWFEDATAEAREEKLKQLGI